MKSKSKIQIKNLEQTFSQFGFSAISNSKSNNNFLFFFTRLISRIRQNLFNYSVSKIKDPQQIFGMFWECMKPIKVMLTQFWLLLGTVWNLSKQGSPNFDWFWGTVWYQIPIKVRFTTRHTKFENEDFQHFEFFQIPNLEGHKAYQVRKWGFSALRILSNFHSRGPQGIPSFLGIVWYLSK